MKTKLIIISLILLHVIFISITCLDKNKKDILKSKSEVILSKIIFKAEMKKWKELPMGELMGKIGSELIGTPYLGFTLEGDPEKCTVNLEGLDCVTFFENVLNIAKMIKNSERSHNDLIKNVTYTRYRDGKLTDYTSRLHYTSDWMYDNEKKKIVKDLSKEIGGDIFKFQLSFMSTHSDSYIALKNHPEYVKTITETEKQINKRKYYYIPKDKIKDIEKKLKTGDIIAFATSMDGLDYTHTGIVFVDKDGNARLMHASSVKKKVVLDTTISEYIKPIKKDIGISVLRVLD